MEEGTAVIVNWPTLLAYLAAALAPTITGFLQQFSTKFSETTPWYLKSLVTSALGALTTVVVSYLAEAEASVAAGAVLATIGSVNIALRKGSRDHLNTLRTVQLEQAVLAFAEEKTNTKQPVPTD